MPLDGRMLGGRIGQNEQVLVCGVLEEIEDALFLEQSRDEIESTLTILDTVLALDLARLKVPKLEIGVAVALEDVGDDLLDTLLLIDATVGGEREEPEPRDHLEAILGQSLGVAGPLGEAGDPTMEISEDAVVALKADADGLTQQVLERNGGIVREEIKLEAERHGDAFLSPKAAKEEDIRPQRSGEVHRTVEMSKHDAALPGNSR
jgi:hypothetical protein